MTDWVPIIIALGVVAFLIWMLIPMSPGSAQGVGESGVLIDPDNTYQIAMLAGMIGQDAPDAAVMKYALDRFQSIYGRKATIGEIGIVLGLIQDPQ